MKTTLKFLLITTSLVASQLTGLFIAQAKAAPNDERLGRLFSLPNERNKLNYLRQNRPLKAIKTIEESPVEKPAEEVMPIALPDPIAMQGYVKRSDGQSTLWINSQAVQEGSTVDNVKIGKLNQRGFSKKGASVEGVEITIPANGKRVRLKPSQTYMPENNKVYEMQVVEKGKRLSLEESGVIDDDAVFDKSSQFNAVN